MKVNEERQVRIVQEIIEALSESFLFKEIRRKELDDIVGKMIYRRFKYKKGQIIAHEDEPCTTLGVILKGEVEIQRLYSSGKTIVLSRFSKGDVFGEAILFASTSAYPATVAAVTDCEILYINRDEILKIFTQNEVALNNFLVLLSNKIMILNSKIKNISFKSIRQKVINYILVKSKDGMIKHIILKENKEVIAAELGIPRPSLSRELINLRELGYIAFDRGSIDILDLEALEAEMME